MRRDLSFANVTSCLALFIALGGISYAAIKLPRNSVGTAQIKNAQVKKADVARNAISSGSVIDGSLLAKDFKKGELPAGSGGTGTSGSNGTPGAPGAPGTPGAAGRDGAALVNTATYTGVGSGYTVGQGSFTTLALANKTWTQPANALDFFFARMRIIRDTGTTCDQAGQTLEAYIRLDGDSASTQPIEVQSSGTHVLAFKPPYTWLVPTGAQTSHSVEFFAKSNCGDVGSWRIQEVRIDVVRAVSG
jgi:hypothetical protein